MPNHGVLLSSSRPLEPLDHERKMDFIIGMTMWLSPIFFVVFLVNWVVFGLVIKSLSIKRIAVFSAILVVLTSLITLAGFAIDYQNLGLPWFYGGHIIQLSLWVIISPLFFILLKRNVTSLKVIVFSIVLNILVLILVNDLLVTTLMVLPAHRRYLLFDLLGI